jgi:nucleotide-binding universal stress UspA family protein
MSTRHQLDRQVPSGMTSAAGRPILLATMGAPFDEEAVAVAVDAAVESGEALIVANITRLEPLALSVMMGYDALEEFTPDVSRSVKRPARLAAEFGVRVERLRVRSPRPVSALLELVRERQPGLVVFGPDRQKLSRRLYRKASEALRAGVGYLVWLPPEIDWRGRSSVG